MPKISRLRLRADLGDIVGPGEVIQSGEPLDAAIFGVVPVGEATAGAVHIVGHVGSRVETLATFAHHRADRAGGNLRAHATARELVHHELVSLAKVTR